MNDRPNQAELCRWTINALRVASCCKQIKVPTEVKKPSCRYFDKRPVQGVSRLNQDYEENESVDDEPIDAEEETGFHEDATYEEFDAEESTESHGEASYEQCNDRWSELTQNTYLKHDLGIFEEPSQGYKVLNSLPPPRPRPGGGSGNGE